MIFKIQSENELVLYSPGTGVFNDTKFECRSNLGEYERRINHYLKWCNDHHRGFHFDLTFFTNETPNKILSRRCSIDRVYPQLYKIVFAPPKAFDESELGKSLNLLRNIKDPVLVTEVEPIELPGPRIIFCNLAYELESGYKSQEILGKSPRILQGVETEVVAKQAIRKNLLEWKPFRQEITNYTKRKDKFLVELSISPVKDETGWWTHWVSFQRNITAEKTEQIHTLTQSRLASMGTLSAGIGHEINNPLMIAIGKLDKLKRELNLHDNEIIKDLELAHQRIIKITDGLRTFSYNKDQMEYFDLVPLIDQFVNFIHDIYLNDSIDLIFNNPQNEPLFVHANPSQIQQIVMNLVSNARDAIDRLKVKKIEITINADHHQVYLSVNDNGPGIPVEIRDKIFDTFFTTKTIGKGTGLGLAISTEILKKHGGSLELKVNKGLTTFFMTLPRITDKGLIQDEPIVDHPKIDSPLEISVLLVEDEEDIREILNDLFSPKVLMIKSVSSGADALKLIGEGHKFDLVLSDVMMPYMDGIEFFVKLRGLKNIKQPKFVFISGAREPEIDKNIRHDYFLSKPFSENDINLLLTTLFPK